MQFQMCCVVTIGLSSLSLGDTLHVDDDGLDNPNAAYSTIQDAVDDAVNGDMVHVHRGTYTSDGDAVVDLGNKNIMLHSADGQEETFIDGEGVRRGVVAEEGDCSIIGFTITNCVAVDVSGYNYNGGGMYFGNGSTNVISNCTITGNSAVDPDNWFGAGGGIYAFGGSTTISNCTISDNDAKSHGGGIRLYQGSNAQILNCVVTGNYAGAVDGGGGLSISDVTTTVTDSTISNNQAYFGGGGIVIASPKQVVTVQNCSITGNAAGANDGLGGGGGIKVGSFSSPQITGCVIDQNTANGGGGGGIYYFGELGGQLVDCAVTRNAASGSGGGILCGDQNLLDVDSCRIIGNTSGLFGGGVACIDHSDGTFDDCIISGNQAADGGGVYSNASAPVYSYCTIVGNEATNGYGTGSRSEGDSPPNIPTFHGYVNCGNLPMAGQQNSGSAYGIDVIWNCMICEPDSNGVMNILDLLEILEQYGQVCATDDYCPSDIDSDGQVGRDDVLLIVEHWHWLAPGC